jgi:hypothetical protein
MLRGSVTSVVALIALALGGCSNGLEEGMPSNITETPQPPKVVTNHMRDYAKQIGAGRRSRGPTSNRPPGR